MHHFSTHLYLSQRLCPSKAGTQAPPTAPRPSPLTATPMHHLMIGMDSNLHHPLWNPSFYPHSHRETNNLISMMVKEGLSIRLACGLPTFYPPHLTYANTTMNLTWISPMCMYWDTSCDTNVTHQFSHLSDHTAILTTITPPAALPQTQKAYRDWNKFDQHSFVTKLSSRLGPTLPTLQLLATDQPSINTHTTLAVNAVIGSMHQIVPKKPAKANSKPWWDKLVFDPLKATAQQLRRRYQRQRTTSTKKDYLKATQAFQKAI